MSIEEKRREGFEAFCISEAGGYCEEHLERDEHGQYTILWEYWGLWNAALDSVVIQLPEPWTEAFMKSESMLQDCKFAIESAGLKVKS